MRTIRLATVVDNVVEKRVMLHGTRIDLEDVESATGQLRKTPLDRLGEGLSVRRGDVLFSKLRPYLRKSLLAETETTCSPEFLVLRPRREVYPRFLAYVVQGDAFVSAAVASTDGAKMPRTSFDRLRDFRVPIPGFQQQRSIGDFLDVEIKRIDALSSNAKRLLLLTSERLDCEASRVLASASPEPSRLRRVVENVEVGVVVRPAALYAPDGIPFLRGVNIGPGKIILDDLKYLDPGKAAMAAKSKLRAGDVVVVRTGQAGAAAVIPPALDGVNCVDVLIVRPGPYLVPQYLELLLNSEAVRDQVATLTVGSIQEHFNVAALREVLVPVPGLARQHEVVTEMTKVEARHRQLASAADRQLALLRERRQALVNAAITGRLRIPSGARSTAAA